MVITKLIAKRFRRNVFKRLVSMIMVAIMLGISNIILEENRSVNDSRVKTEILEVMDDNDPQ